MGTHSHYAMQNVVESNLSVYGGIVKKRLTSYHIDNNVEVYSCNLLTWLVKQCVDQLLSLLISIINESLTKGEFPNDFQNAIVKPLLKKPSLDKDELKNYRPPLYIKSY